MKSMWYKSELTLGELEKMGFICKIENDLPMAESPWLKRAEYVYYSKEHKRDWIKLHTSDAIIKNVYYVLNSHDIRGEIKNPQSLELFEKLAELNYPPAISYMRKHYIDVALEDIT